MTKKTSKNTGKAGNVSDFVEGVTDDNPLYLEVAVNDIGKVIVYHDKIFKSDVAWFEFDLATNKLDFIMDDGDVRDIGMSLHQDLAKNMHNSHQVHLILIDKKTKEQKAANYVPLIIHQAA